MNTINAYDAKLVIIDNTNTQLTVKHIQLLEQFQLLSLLCMLPLQTQQQVYDIVLQ